MFDLQDGNETKAPGKSGIAKHNCNCRCFLEYNLMTEKEFAEATNQTVEQVREKYNKGVENTVVNPVKNKVEKSVDSDIINLTDDEQYAINSYISSGSYVVNEKLRNGITLTANETKLVADLETALDKMPKYSDNLSRSVYFDDNEKLAEFINGHKVGSTVTYRAFTSTTKGGIYNEKANVQIYIKNAKSGGRY